MCARVQPSKIYQIDRVRAVTCDGHVVGVPAEPTHVPTSSSAHANDTLVAGIVTLIHELGGFYMCPGVDLTQTLLRCVMHGISIEKSRSQHTDFNKTKPPTSTHGMLMSGKQPSLTAFVVCRFMLPSFAVTCASRWCHSTTTSQLN
jgi:hypothetical protein